MKTGDICYLQHAVKFERLNGEEVVIVGDEDHHYKRDGSTSFGFKIKLINKEMPDNLDFLVAKRHQLKKKPNSDPKLDHEIGTWSDCLWSPMNHGSKTPNT